MLNPEELERHPEQSDEIRREIAELKRLDEEKRRHDMVKAKERIQKHVDDHGGDLSLLLSLPVSSEVRCVQLTSFGSSKNIQTTKMPLPLPQRQEVLIRAHSCGVNVTDLMMRQGLMDPWVRTLKPPFVLGSELAGEVVGVGRDVKGFVLGDRVVAFPERRGWSEYAVARWDYCFKIPDEMNYNDAVALVLNGVVAYSLIFELGNLRPNKSVLLHSAPGGLGNMIAQMARSVNNVRLFKIVSNPKEESEWDRNTHFIDRDTDYVSEVRHVSPHGVDLVLDCEYEDNFSRDLNLIRPMGRYVLFGTHSAITGEGRGFFESAKAWWGQDKISPLKLFEENKTISGFNLRHLMYFHRNHAYIREAVDQVFELWRNGTIQPVFDCVLSLNDVDEALHRLTEQGQTGKIILDPTMSAMEAKHERDYFILAEKNVAERRKQAAPSMFRLPAAGDLVRDVPEDVVKEEEAARPSREAQAAQQQQLFQKEQKLPPTPEELERQRYFLKQYLTPEQQLMLVEEKLTPEQQRDLHNKLLQSLPYELQQQLLNQFQQPLGIQPTIQQQPMMAGVVPQAGLTITTTTVQQGAPTEPAIEPMMGAPGLVPEQSLQPSPSPYSVEKVISDLESAKLAETGGELSGQPIYRKQEVEVKVPLSGKEVQQIAEELPGELAGQEKSSQTFIEKLRDTFAPQQRNE